MTTSCCLHLICNKVTRLQRIRHSRGAHADPIANTDGTKLVANETRLDQGTLDFLPQAKQVSVASESTLAKKIIYDMHSSSRIAFIP